MYVSRFPSALQTSSSSLLPSAFLNSLGRKCAIYFPLCATSLHSKLLHFGSSSSFSSSSSSSLSAVRRFSSLPTATAFCARNKATFFQNGIHNVNKTRLFSSFLLSSSHHLNVQKKNNKYIRCLQTGKEGAKTHTNEVYYTKSHEYIKRDETKKNVWKVGVTTYAIKQLGEVVYIEFPEKGKYVKKGEVLLTIESVKAVGEVYAPCNMHILDFNDKLRDEVYLLNESPESDGWLVEAKLMKNEETEDTEEGVRTAMMNKDEYTALCNSKDNSDH